VLRLSKVGIGGHAYYLDAALGSGGPGVEPPGRWTGAGAGVLGLDGRVEPDDFVALLAGRDPGDGSALATGAGRGRVKVAGYDLTFCAPKSVSLLGALGGDEVGRAVEVAHGRAVDAGLGYLEDRAFAVRRRRDGLRLPVEVEGVASASFLHRTSRALDPHLHEHVVVANVGRGPDGRWTALDGRGLYAHAGAAASVYHAQLRHELTTVLGVTWTVPERGRAEVTGIDAGVRRVFSTRTTAIDDHVAEGGWTSARARAVAAHVTRQEKEHVPTSELRPEWERRAGEAGFGPRRLEAVLDRAVRRDRGAPAVPESEIAHGLGEWAKAHDTIARRDVVGVVAGAARAGASRHEVEEQVDRTLRAAGLADDRGRVGVAERRVPMPASLERRELHELLVRRGLDPVRSRHLGREAGIGLSLG